jgi:hypothetical protein
MVRGILIHVSMRRFVKSTIAVSLALLTCSCATTQARFVALGQKYPPRPENCVVGIYKGMLPQRAFERVSRLDLHIEKTFFAESDLESALPEIKKQACLSGADAIIEIQERTTRHIENRAYHLTATGIKFKN